MGTESRSEGTHTVSVAAGEKPNAAQIEYWNCLSGPKWVALGDRIDAQIEPLGRAVMDRAAVRPGQRILDVGCGCGQTTLELAERVGPKGRVVGVDVSAVMLEHARERAARAGAGNVHFLEADAQTHSFEPGGFDLVYSRFGLMFFEDPKAAFVNLGRTLRRDGRLAFVCWQPLARNPWIRVPLEAVARHVEIPPPSDPHAPGPFAFADAERVRALLEAAGFRGIQVEGLERELAVGGGGDLEATVEFLLQIGPAGAALREAPPPVRARAAEAVREALVPYAGEGVRIPSAAWIFSARWPG